MEQETQTQKLFRLWPGSLTTEEIAAELEVTMSRLAAMARQHKLPNRVRSRSVDNENPRPNDPSPEELQARMLEVQADWSDEERLRRFQGKRRVAYIMPQYEYDGRSASFNGLN